VTTILENPHARALITKMETLTVANAPLPVGDAVAPKSSDGKVVAPCAVLYLLPGGGLTGSLGCIDTDGWVRFQVTCVGKTAVQARIVGDVVTDALTSEEPSVTDRWIANIRRVGPSSLTERDDDLVPPLFYVTPQFRMLTLAA
jgi:hypothetical protein